MNAFTNEDLMEFQAESLNEKFQRSFSQVSAWYSYWNSEVYVSFSGGKDSTVLADICARWCKVVGKTLYLVFVNTGLEYPEIQRHVKFFALWLRDKYGIEVVLDILRPEMRFDEVVAKYGYPLITKRVADTVEGARRSIAKGVDSMRLKCIEGRYQDRDDGRKSMFNFDRWNPLLGVHIDISSKCCDVMKKAPLKKYARETGRKPILGTMATESMARKTAWLKNGCNAFDGPDPQSRPMSFWTEQDVLQYIKDEELPIPSVYGDIVYAEDSDQMRIEDFGIEVGGTEKLTTTGCDRTGCIFCGFGCHLEKGPSRFERLKETHPRQYKYCIEGGEYDENGKWKPNKQGLGMGHVFDELNKIYGDDFIKY